MNGLPPGVLSKPMDSQGSVNVKITRQQGNTLPMKKNENVGYHATTYEDDEVISPIQWFLSMVMYSIPLVNIFYVLAIFMKDDNECKQNWAKASTIMLVISYAVQIVVLLLLKRI